MFHRWLLVSAIAVIWLGFASSSVQAQAKGGRNKPGQPDFNGVLSRPAIPPILNLNRAGATPAENYFNLVQPQVQQREATLQQGRQINQLRGEVQKSSAFRASAVGRMSPTGHHAGFMNMSHYHKGGGSSGGR